MARYFWTIIALLLANLPAAFACPGCKEPSSVAGQAGVNGVSLGFSASVLFMLGMIATILGGMLYMIVQACKQLDAQHAKALSVPPPQPTS
ncbi:MAG: hypothetical protein JO069_16430 [Verrucomicrobia bacterium]|nr:hypothetical protein [Verrucomicrobiota bacterium]